MERARGRTSRSSGRITVMTMLALAVLVARVDGSWWNWLWLEDSSSPVPPCLGPMAHAHSVSDTLTAWRMYMLEKKSNLSAESEEAVGTFLMFLHETYTPCLVSELGGKSEEWRTYLGDLVTSSGFILSIPGFISLLILIIQAVKSKCCAGRNKRPRGSHRLLKRRVTTGTPRFMQ